MNYAKYFITGQKVFLINIGTDRNSTIYDSFSGTVAACTDEYLDLIPSYRLTQDGSCPYTVGNLFKVTSESFNMGVELCAAFDCTPKGEIIRLVPKGQLEIYQRRHTTRVDTRLPCLNVPQKSSLTAFRREWNRVVADLHKENPPKLKLAEMPVNISAGGLRIEQSSEPTTLSIMVIDLKDEAPPVCAIVELVWKKELETGSFTSGYRFVNILKEDQKRIYNLVEAEIRKQGLSVKMHKMERELVDQMSTDKSTHG
jgi:hypothetical protein